MTNKHRNKKVWFVPKRANVHQMIALLHGIVSRKYDGTTWNTHKQDNLNLELKKLGATQKGQKIAPQGMRTLLASAQYLGFVYLDNTTTPTILRVTQAGYDFYNLHKKDLVPIENLVKGPTIKASESVLIQMNKLQITNPIILPYCEDIYVFPFRVILKMLQSLKYLDIEEIAMYVFHTQSMSQIPYKIMEIEHFRKLKTEDRVALVNQYKKTSIGNITLNQAASASYFMTFCEGTGIITKANITTNTQKKVRAIHIKDGFEKYVNELLEYYQETETYDFKNDLNLWIQYFGNPSRLTPPTILIINNSLKDEVYLELLNKKQEVIGTTLLDAANSYNIPVFTKESYTLKTYDISSNTLLYSKDFKAQKEMIIDIESDKINKTETTTSFAMLEFNEVVQEIIEHSNSKNFSERMLIKLRLLESKLGINKVEDKSLRGAQYEYLFYLLLLHLKKIQVIDDVIWNGKMGKYNLPTQAPGGKTGTPDIIFIIDKTRYVLELTTIKAKSTQFSAEGSSVPDHIRLYQQDYPHIVVKGIFCAPLIHTRVHRVMKQTILSHDNIPFISLSEENFLEVLKSKKKKELLNKLNMYFKEC